MQSDNLIKLKELTDKICKYENDEVYIKSIQEIKENIHQFEQDLKNNVVSKNKISSYEKLHNKIKKIIDNILI
jgi:hypothetical protein